MGGGGYDQIVEPGFPQWAQPFVENQMMPFVSNWLQGQQQINNPYSYLQGASFNNPATQVNWNKPAGFKSGSGSLGNQIFSGNDTPVSRPGQYKL